MAASPGIRAGTRMPSRAPTNIRRFQGAEGESDDALVETAGTAHAQRRSIGCRDH